MSFLPCLFIFHVKCFFFMQLIALVWIGLGVCLTVIIILNSNLPLDDQIRFEKLHIVDQLDPNAFYNEPSFAFTHLENLKLYLFSMSIIATLGGVGRGIATLCFLHYIYKVKITGFTESSHFIKNTFKIFQKKLSYVMAWAWVILSMLAVVSLAVITVDTLYTLSHNDVSPPYSRDFYFENDHFGFYTFCHVFKYFIMVDFVLVSYFQWVVRWAQRNPIFSSPPRL